jgi:hypothetical protein
MSFVFSFLVASPMMVGWIKGTQKRQKWVKGISFAFTKCFRFDHRMQVDGGCRQPLIFALPSENFHPRKLAFDVIHNSRIMFKLLQIIYSSKAGKHKWKQRTSKERGKNKILKKTCKLYASVSLQSEMTGKSIVDKGFFN